MTRDLVKEADALEQSGAFAEAIERWRAAVTEERGPEALARLGDLLVHQGHEAEGQQVLREAIFNYPDYAPAFFYLGVYHKQRGDTGEARVLLEKSVQLAPLAPALVELGHVYRYSKMHEEARQCFERATAADPNDAEGWFGLGVLERFVAVERAIELFKKATELDPENVAALRELGHMLWRRGDLPSAEEHLRAAIRLNERDVWAHDYLGSVLRRTDRDEEAEREFRAAIALWPGQPLFHCNLGEVLVRLAREAEAEQEYKAALSLDASGYLPNLRMGHLLRDQGKLAEARMYLECALHADPSDHRAQEGLAELPPESPGDPRITH